MAEKKESRAASQMGGEKKSSKKSDGKKSDGKKAKHKVHVMHIKHADNPDGGWIATHDMNPPDDGGAMPPSEDHMVPAGMDNLQAHVADHMDQTPEPEPAPAGGGGAPPAGGNPAAALGM